MAELNPAFLDRLVALLGARNVLPGERMARYTTWKVGGPADVLCVALSVERLCDAVALAGEVGVPWLVLGRGSNVLVADAGINGMVVLNRCARIIIQDHTVYGEAGAMLSALSKRTAAAGLRGLEWAAGIPGTVGGAVVNNAGAHGGDIASVLRGVTVLRADGRVQAYDAAELRLGYRNSLFREGARAQTRGGDAILSASFALMADDRAALEEALSRQRQQRRASQPQGKASAGSVFKNPPGDSAGRLIDGLGLKGLTIGGAQVSPAHANFMVNLGTATAEDVVALIQLIRRRVSAAYGIELEPEVQQIGRWPKGILGRVGS